MEMSEEDRQEWRGLLGVVRSQESFRVQKTHFVEFCVENKEDEGRKAKKKRKETWTSTEESGGENRYSESF